jgi:hypothetical protein
MTNRSTKWARVSKEHVSDWELGQVLSARAQHLEKRGRFKEALDGYLALAELHRGNWLSYGHALASTLEGRSSWQFALVREKRRSNWRKR